MRILNHLSFHLKNDKHINMLIINNSLWKIKTSGKKNTISNFLPIYEYMDEHEVSRFSYLFLHSILEILLYVIINNDIQKLTNTQALFFGGVSLTP